jgi:hypothetical protein
MLILAKNKENIKPKNKTKKFSKILKNMNKFETMYFEMLGECDFEGDEKYIKWLLFVVVIANPHKTFIKKSKTPNIKTIQFIIKL